MPRFKVFCAWAVIGELYIEAPSVEEAIAIANDPDQDPPEGEYLVDSFKVNEELTKYMNGPKGYDR